MQQAQGAVNVYLPIIQASNVLNQGSGRSGYPRPQDIQAKFEKYNSGGEPFEDINVDTGGSVERAMERYRSSKANNGTNTNTTQTAHLDH
jgi:hypothetical protein